MEEKIGQNKINNINNKDNDLMEKYSTEINNNEENKIKQLLNNNQKTQLDRRYSNNITENATRLFKKIENPKTMYVPNEILFDRERCHYLNTIMIYKGKENLSLKLDSFYKKKRHFLIMTEGGNPIYSRYGDAIENNSIFATISAIIIKFTFFNNKQNFKEQLNVISNDKSKIVFLQKGKLIFIAISKKNDTISLLQSQLEYLSNQLMSVLTFKNFEKLENSPSKCLSIISVMNYLFEQTIKYSSHSFVSLFNSYHVMSYISHRKKLNKIIEESLGDALYCILLSPYEIISISHSKIINVVPSDLVLIQTLIYINEIIRTQVSYVPICLPGISTQGYVQLYGGFTKENIGIFFVTEKMEPDLISKLEIQYKKLYQKLINSDAMERIMNSMLYNNNIMKEITLMKSKSEINNNDINKANTNLTINKLSDNDIFRLSNAEINGKNKTNTLKRTLTEIPNNNDLFRKKKMEENLVNKKIKKEESQLFKNIIYGVALNRKLNQYFLINFDMDYRLLSKEEKQLMRQYNILFDIYNSDQKNKEKNNYYFADKKGDFINILLVDEKFLTICSYDFILGMDNAINQSYDFHRFLNKKENKYFILYKK